MKVVCLNDDVLYGPVTPRSLTTRTIITAVDTLVSWKMCWLYYQQGRCFSEHIHTFVRNVSINPVRLCNFMKLIYQRSGRSRREQNAHANHDCCFHFCPRHNFQCSFDEG